jgi:hypothetical protein
MIREVVKKCQCISVDKFRIHIINSSKGQLNETFITSSTINVTSIANMNLWKRKVRPPDTGNDKPDLENSSETPQGQAEVLQGTSSERLNFPVRQAVQASLSVGFGKM